MGDPLARRRRPAAAAAGPLRLGPAHPGGPSGSSSPAWRRCSRSASSSSSPTRSSSAATRVRPAATRWRRTSADSIRTGWLTDVAKTVSGFGSGAFTWPLACDLRGGAGGPAALERVLRPLIGMLITIIGVHVLKDAVDRPRPAGGLVDSPGSSFPSGHAAYSMLYVWLALTVVVRLRPGISRGTPDRRRRHLAGGAHRPLAGLPAASTT